MGDGPSVGPSRPLVGTRVARAAVVSSAAAPVLLVGGWTVAASRQPGGFDPVTQSISALAALGAQDRWIMTSALAGVGVCHLVTAIGLPAAAAPGRALLGLGGVGTLLVATLPLPADNGSSAAHAGAAAVAFGALGAWPAGSWRRRTGTTALRRPVALGAAAGLLGLVGWFVAELAGGRLLGLAERCAAGAQAVWPAVVVLSCVRAAADSAHAGTRKGR